MKHLTSKVWPWFIVLFFATSGLNATAQSWDAATCYDLCYILLNDGYYVDDILVGKYHYKVEQNESYGDQVFVTFYSKNMELDVYGNIVRFSKTGVSNVVSALKNTGNSTPMGMTLFSLANAKKFRDQALELGFKKWKVSGGKTYYTLKNLVMEEFTDKWGGRKCYNFTIYFQ